MIKCFADIAEDGYEIQTKYEIADLIFKKTCNAYRNKEINVEEIISYMLSLLFVCITINSKHLFSYASIMKERIAYELCIELYSNTLVSDKEATHKTVDKLKHYIKRTGVSGNLTTYTSSYSNSRKNTLKDLSRIYDSSLKYNRYRLFMSEVLATDACNTCVSGDDIVFYVMNHSKGIYSSKNFSSGMPYTNFSYFVSDYLAMLQNNNKNITPLEYELSAYYFQKLFYGISYQKFTYNLAESISSDNKLSKPDSALYMYTRLHDTHHLSLTDYILDTYFNNSYDIFNYDTYNSALSKAYFDFRILESFFLPMLKYIFAAVLYELFNKDCKQIASVLKKYIIGFEYKTSSVYTYKQMLLTANNNINHMLSRLHNGTDFITKKKLSIISPSEKNDRPSYKLSCQLCRLFFENDSNLLLMHPFKPFTEKYAIGASFHKVPIAYTSSDPANRIIIYDPIEFETVIKRL